MQIWDGSFFGSHRSVIEKLMPIFPSYLYLISSQLRLLKIVYIPFKLLFICINVSFLH